MTKKLYEIYLEARKEVFAKQSTMTNMKFIHSIYWGNLKPQI